MCLREFLVFRGFIMKWLHDEGKLENHATFRRNFVLFLSDIRPTCYPLT